MKSFPLEPYGFTVHFTASKKEMDKALAEVYPESVGEECAGQCWRNGKQIYIGVFDEGKECIDTLAHEIQHALLDIAVFIQYDPSGQQEPFCYLAGYMMKTLMFAHPKFKEAMNESVGTRAGDGGRRQGSGEAPHREERGTGKKPRQPVRSGSVSPVCPTAGGSDSDVPVGS